MGPPRPLRPMVMIPEHVEAAIIRSLAKDPAERFATASEFADALAGRAVPSAAPAPVAADHTAVSRASSRGGPAAQTDAAVKKKGCAGVLLAGVGLAGAAAGMLRLLL
jgi:eukaryotic-like serine/threonine-protein kinase